MHLSGHAHISHPMPTLAYACLPACAHACLPVPVGKFFFSFLSACVHNCNLHVPTCASTPLPVPTHMHLSGHAPAFLPTPACMHLLQLCLPGHACFLTWAWACPCLPHPCTCVSATPIAMHLTSSCTQRSPQLWVFSDAGAVNSTKGVSGRQWVYSYLSTWLWVAGTGRCAYRYRWAPKPTLQVWVWNRVFKVRTPTHTLYGYRYVTHMGWLNLCQSLLTIPICKHQMHIYSFILCTLV